MYTTLRPALPNPSNSNDPPPLPHATFYSSMGPDYEVLGNKQLQVEQTITEQQLPQVLEQQGDHTYQVLDCVNEKKQLGAISEVESGEDRAAESPNRYEVPVKLQIKKEERESND